MNLMRLPLLLLCAALSAASAAQADDLGRLFTTPGERARIDALRSGSTSTAPAAQATIAAEQIILNGTLTGSDGRRLAWVNGAPIDPARAGREISLLRGGAVRVQLRDGALKRDLKPGQGVDTASGQVFETYERVPAPAPASPAPDATPPAVAASPSANEPAPAKSDEKAQP